MRWLGRRWITEALPVLVKQESSMPKRTSTTGSELFIVDNSEEDWKVLRYLHDWCQFSKSIDIATGYFEIGSLLALEDEWQKVDHIRILMGDEVSLRTKNAFAEGFQRVRQRLDRNLPQSRRQFGLRAQSKREDLNPYNAKEQARGHAENLDAPWTISEGLEKEAREAKRGLWRGSSARSCRGVTASS